VIEFIELSDDEGATLHVRADSVSAVGRKVTVGSYVDTMGGHTYFVQQSPELIMGAVLDALARQQEAEYAARAAVGRGVLYGTPPVVEAYNANSADDCPF
jgi:hypothetical protein